mgnify:CR=1 FL=1
MPCSSCPKRDLCRTLCPEAGRYVSQDERYLREVPLPLPLLDHLAQAISLAAWFSLEDGGPRHPPSLASLSPRERECLELHFFEGLPLSQVAKKLSLSKSTVQSYIREAMIKLRR